ncbi:tRNA-intron lyase [Candidatus Woesearchaeota archaeon]|nr:tRNA-intron lyase [Candidatus Woesearchaeota archaeon]
MPKKKETKKKTVKKTVKKETTKSKIKKEPLKALFAHERVIIESSEEAQTVYNNGIYGTLLEDKKLQLSLQEALFLMEKQKISIFDSRNKTFTFERFVKRATNIEPTFWIRYGVYKDMRSRGYIVKTALKFGADFRVYDRGIKPGEDHARWVVYPVHEGSTLTWYDFAAKNRVAHSTKKRLMMGVVDDEGDVTYWEIKWLRP